MKCHIYEAEQVVRSVLLGKTATAQCGVTKILTREDIDTAAGRAACKACMQALSVDREEFTIASPRGWTSLLERWVTAMLTPPVGSYTVTASYPIKWL